jgi:hypothetical protein
MPPQIAYDQSMGSRTPHTTQTGQIVLLGICFLNDPHARILFFKFVSDLYNSALRAAERQGRRPADFEDFRAICRRSARQLVFLVFGVV